MFAALQCSEFKELWAALDHKSELAKLHQTVSTIKAVLLDAETKPGSLSNKSQHYIDELKEAVFEADDVFDKWVTLSKRKHLIMEDGKLSEKVRLLLSRLNQLIFGNMSKRVNNVRSKLDDFASNHKKFGFDNVNDNETSSKYKREDNETSRIHAFDLIGREVDVENIVSVLINPVVEEDVSFLSVVGMGGLGKTALSQFVSNDERVLSAFSLTLWTCVSDHGQDQLNIASVLAKILESVTGKKPHSESSLDNVQKRLRASLAGKKFLLVLDDVWNESRNNRIKLAGFLTGGQRGSWVLVTTRSKETARVIGNGLTYELPGLSKESSWKLFGRMAFGHGKTPPDEFIQVGKDIVKSCGDVPLVIRMFGSRLYGLSKSRWVSFRQKELANVRSLDDNEIMSVLKLSYNGLKPSLRSCFSYCALFPKDFVINKETLIGLWMAQGYITPSESGLTIDDVAEDYFFTLLQKGFFQDVKKRRVW